ncbi:MAG: GtrA family protein [Pseudomonadota bacterium]
MTNSHQRFLGFAFVGAIGFVVDATILTVLMKGFGFGPYAARAISFGAAVTVTWYLNRRWVFDHQAMPMSRREYGSYVVVQTIGALINLGVFVLVIRALPNLIDIPVIPLAIGSGVAMLFNFVASGRWVFASPKNRGTDG